MIPPVSQRPRARLDLLEQFVYFAERASVSLAERYFAAVDATCLQLVDHPQSGVMYDSGVAGLEGLRKLPVKGFENYLLFYIPQAHGIDVIRVIHGARDIPHIFANDEG